MSSGEHALALDDVVLADGPPMTEDDWHQENAEALAALYAEECGDAPCALHVHRSAPSRLGEPARTLLAIRKGAAMAVEKMMAVLECEEGDDEVYRQLTSGIREELGLAPGEPLYPGEASPGEDDAPTLLSAEMAVTAGDDPNDGMEPSAYDDDPDRTWPGLEER